MKLVLLFLGLGLLSLLRVQAQVVQLAEVKVVATPIVADTAIDDHANRVITVGAEQIEALNAQDLTSALRRTPGVTITRYNAVGAFGGGEGGAVLIRGIGSSRPGGEIVTLVDGVPNYNGVFNHPLLDLLSVDAAAQIEIAPRASVVATGNLFASINLTPPRATIEGASAEAMVQAGSFGAWSEKISAGYKAHAFNAYAVQSHREAKGHRPDAEGALNNYLLHLGWKPTADWEIRYVINRTNNSATDPGPTAGTGLPATRGDVYRTANWLQVLTAAWTGERATGHLKGYINTGDAIWLRRTTSNNADSLNDFRLSGVRAREALPLAGGEMIFGADYDLMAGKSIAVPPGAAPSVSFGPEQFALFSTYVGWKRMWVTGAWHIAPSMGMRWYEHEEFGHASGAEVGLVVRRGHQQWHFGANRAVKFPGLEVAAFSVVGIPALGQSWRALGPEKLDQCELGWRGEFAQGKVVELTIFRNEGRDRYVFVPPPPPPFRFVNVEKFTTAGAELALTVRPVKTVSLYGAVALLRVTPEDLPYAPKLAVTGGAAWQIGRAWSLQVDASYQSEQRAASQARAHGAPNLERVGAFALVNARLAWSFAQGEVFVAGENLLDRDYRYRPGYPMPGCGGSIGVKMRF